MILVFIGPEHRGRGMNIEDGDETLLATGLPFAIAKDETRKAAEEEEIEEQREREKGVGESRREVV
jgi:hypothetical protein